MCTRKKLNWVITFRNRPEYDDSEDESTINWKNDDNQPEEDLAGKLARRDTIARKEEITQLQQKATTKDMQSRKNDVSLSMIFQKLLGSNFQNSVVCSLRLLPIVSK